jgi:hypothetical protein
MSNEINFLSERQNNHLLEQVFAATDYKKLKVFLDSFSFKPYKVKAIPDKWDIDWLYVNSLSKYSAFIFSTNHSLNADLICFKTFDGAEAVLHIYHSAGINKEPIPVIHYYYPIKIINFPYMKRYREIKKCIDSKSHRVSKDPVLKIIDRNGNEMGLS